MRIGLGTCPLQVGIVAQEGGRLPSSPLVIRAFGSGLRGPMPEATPVSKGRGVIRQARAQLNG
eukprot:755703-Pyramimonas_sp.AAC.1